MKDFKEGEYVIYQDGNRYELGKIKRIINGSIFVYYTSGNTASKTSISHLHKLTNAYVIGETSLGGAME